MAFIHLVSHELLEQYLKEDRLSKTLNDIERMIEYLKQHLHGQ